MKSFIRINQIIVGVLFIISGLVKANDPMGLSYKMQEFFELWITGLKEGHFFAKYLLIGSFEFLHNTSLSLSVVMITLEIVVGVALLLGWMKKMILYVLLSMILFFTFLTGFAYLSGKFTNCGCFGDCLPITPFTSFVKDLVLLGLIMILLAGQKFIRPFSGSKFRNVTMIVSLVLSVMLQWYVLNNLPLADCLPFKKGNNIRVQMKPPPGAISDSTAIRYLYKKDGKQYEWGPDELPPDFDTYTFISRKDQLVRKGNADPRIKGFTLKDTLDADHTDEVLDTPFALLIFAMDDTKAIWLDNLQILLGHAKKNNIPVFLATANQELFIKKLFRYQINIPVFSCDFTVIRTAARTDPTFYLLKRGTIVNKFSRRDMSKIPGALDQVTNP